MNYTEEQDGKYTVNVWSDGTKSWYLNDKLHREDGPAYEYQDGYKAWFLNGKLHREDGPAVECPDIGYKAWLWDGSLVYDKHEDHLSEYPDLQEEFKKSIIKYKLKNM